jgi:hypothetical protein
MKNVKSCILALCAALLIAALPALAHHSFAAVYDPRRPVTLHGTVVKFEMINPHGCITLDVKGGDDGQPVRWMIEVSNPNILSRAGWKKDSLKPGDEATVDGYQAKDGTRTASANLVTLPNGRKVFGGTPVEPHDEVPAPSAK